MVCAAGSAPGESIEIVEHRTAPVQIGQWRRLAFEPDTERRNVIDRQPADAARRHLAGEAAGRFVAAFQGPELAGDPREKQETRRGQRNGHRQRARRQAQRRLRCQRAAIGNDRTARGAPHRQ